jgi:hypothetical protein
MEITKRLGWFTTVLFCICTTQPSLAQITERERPKEWEQLVDGARFRDRFMPMPVGKSAIESDWGAAGVRKRYVDNGIEDRERSYWGGNILLADDGKYHLYVCGWPERSAKGHDEWPNSIVYHTVSDNSIGPFKIVDTIGKGHNPELFRAKNGKYVIYVIDGYYISDSYNGPWKYNKFVFDQRDRPIIEGLSNLTFAKREDGSNLMICRGGGVWFSETGLSPYQQVTDRRVYPAVEGEFEDPVVWRDHIQYHLIVNDWLGRIAFYQRSKDGVNWVTDPGEAYTPGISVHTDGVQEDWFKYERIKVLQDGYGRAYQANFAVIDVQKADDRPNDQHSSKNISIPLNPGMLMEMLNVEFPNAKTASIRIKIQKEPDFDPAVDLDLKSLRFGSSAEVNFGKGSRAIKMEKNKEGVIITFENNGHGLTEDEFAPKIIGRSKSGNLVFGYTRVPWIAYKEAILSARKPRIVKQGDKQILQVQVDNLGQVKSKDAELELYAINGKEQTFLGKQAIPAIAPYAKAQVELEGSLATGDIYPMELIVKSKGVEVSSFRFDLKIE